MYHADRDKGKCDLHGGKRQVFVEQEGRNQPEIELIDASDESHRLESLEKLIQSKGRLSDIISGYKASRSSRLVHALLCGNGALCIAYTGCPHIKDNFL